MGKLFLKIKAEYNFILGTVLLLIPFGYTLLWIHIFNTFHDWDKKVSEYDRFLPPFLKNSNNSVWFFTLCCLISIFYLLRCLHRTENKILKVAAVFMIILASMLIFLNLFQMM